MCELLDLPVVVVVVVFMGGLFLFVPAGRLAVSALLHDYSKLDYCLSLCGLSCGDLTALNICKIATIKKY